MSIRFLSLLIAFTLPALSVSFAGNKTLTARPPGGPLPYLFQSGTDGYHTYRIPAIVRTKKGTLLAFAEGRVHNWGDHGNIDIVMRRSTDNGKTWEKQVVVQDDGNNTCGNPAPVVDWETGRIILLSNGSNSSEGAVMDGKATRECYVQYSNDDGKTWTKRKNISDQVRPDGWRWYAMGPCSGIQIREGKNKYRLVIPANHSDEQKGYASHCLFSNDGGNTWQVGSTAEPGSNESQIAEISPDLLAHNMRMQNNSKGFRGIRYSRDGGKTWTELEHDKNLPCPRCQGSIIRDYSGPGRLFFSNPAAEPRGRRGMAVRASLDGGKTWPFKKTVHEGPSGYSNLVMLGKDKVGLLYEGGEKDLAQGIAFEVFPVKELLSPANRTPQPNGSPAKK